MSVTVCKQCELVIEGADVNGYCPYCGGVASEMPEEDE